MEVLDQLSSIRFSQTQIIIYLLSAFLSYFGFLWYKSFTDSTAGLFSFEAFIVISVFSYPASYLIEYVIGFLNYEAVI